MQNQYQVPLYSPEQKAWCLRFEAETTFEPMMADYEEGKESFDVAAEKNIKWFSGWAHKVQQNIMTGRV